MPQPPTPQQGLSVLHTHRVNPSVHSSESEELFDLLFRSHSVAASLNAQTRPEPYNPVMSPKDEPEVPRPKLRHRSRSSPQCAYSRRPLSTHKHCLEFDHASAVHSRSLQALYGILAPSPDGLYGQILPNFPLADDDRYLRSCTPAALPRHTHLEQMRSPYELDH